MEFLMCLLISYFITKEVGRDVVDGIALSKGKEAPHAGKREAASTSAWKSRTGESAKPGLGHYAKRIASNAAAAAADATSTWLRRRRLKLEALGPQKDNEWLERKLRRTEKRAARAAKFASKCGVAWERTKGAVADLAEQRAEKQAYAEEQAREEAHAEAQAYRENERRNAAERERIAAEATRVRAERVRAERPSPAPGAAVPPPGWNDVYSGWQPAEPASGGGPMGTEDRYEAPAPAVRAPASVVQATAERLDPETGEAAAVPTGPAGLLEPAPTPTNPAGTALAVRPTPTTSEAIPMATAEINNLPAGQAYTAKMQAYTAAVQGVVETYQSQLATLADDIGKELADAELAIGSLANAGFTGGPVSAFATANEQLAAMKSAAEQAKDNLGPMHDQATAAAGAYANAASAFDQQVGIAEQAQTQKASGNLARDTEFYANA
ncbi:hypothetical protein L3Q67_45100 (plasmid) [Saccharothrix sp. AJ9571]|nr:hypothetical protein L3Q67_45100 [Saccharothrix sp. AJ9571]